MWLTLSDSTCPHSRLWPAGWARTRGRDDGGRWHHSGRWFHPHCHWFPPHTLQNNGRFIHNLIQFPPFLTYLHPPMYSKLGSCIVQKIATEKFGKWPMILALLQFTKAVLAVYSNIQVKSNIWHIYYDLFLPSQQVFTYTTSMLES